MSFDFFYRNITDNRKEVGFKETKMGGMKATKLFLRGELN